MCVTALNGVDRWPFLGFKIQNGALYQSFLCEEPHACSIGKRLLDQQKGCRSPRRTGHKGLYIASDGVPRSPCPGTSGPIATSKKRGQDGNPTRQRGRRIKGCFNTIRRLVCSYGYYNNSPFRCTPVGYYDPGYFYNSIFFGRGHGPGGTIATAGGDHRFHGGGGGRCP